MSYNTNFIVNVVGQNIDLGLLINNWNTNTINIPATGTTLGSYSINYSAPTLITESNINATIDGSPLYGDQVYTFGPAIPFKFVEVSGSGGNTIAFSNDGINHYGVSTTLVLGGEMGTAWNGYMWVAVSNGSTTNDIGYSYDGINWVISSNTSTSSGFQSICYAKNIWILGGTTTTNNSILYSYDGVNFIGATNTLTYIQNVWDIKTNGHIILAVGKLTSAAMMYSYNGITWTSPTANLTNLITGTLTCIAWNGSIWVAGGSGTNTLAYTTDPLGLTGWVGFGSLINSVVYNLCWNGSVFIAMGNGSTNTIFYSPDGINWTALGKTIYSTYALSNTWNGRMFLSQGSNGGNTIAYSYNGINWVGIPKSPFNGVGGGTGVAFNAVRPHSITFQRNLTIAGGKSTASTIVYSLDGINWTGLGTSVFSTQGLGVYYNGRIWVMGGQGTNTLAFSQNGISWTGLGSSIFSTYCFQTLWVPYLSLWVAGGLGGNSLAYSYDGMTWISSPTNPFFGGACALATSSNLIIAVGTNNAGIGNTIAYSTNGITWTGVGSPIITLEGFGIAYNGSIWVASGQTTTTTGKLIYSYNGINWTDTGYAGFTSSGRNVAWNGSIWVATGQGTSSTAYSYNGINWTAGTNIFPTYGLTITWNGSVWIAGGGITTYSLAYSYDGITWTGVAGSMSLITTNTYGLGTNFNVKPIPFIQHPTLAFGNGTNTIAYSQDGINWVSLGTTVFSSTGRKAFWNGTIWVATGQGVNTLAYSYDGFNWTGLGASIFTTSGFGITYNGTIWVACGQGVHSIAYSSNGINWTPVANSSQIFVLNGFGVAWNGKAFLASGVGGFAIATSSDGVNWTGVSTAYNISGTNSFIATNGPLWVVGIKTTPGLIYTTDTTGTTGWTTIGTTIFSFGFSVCWNGSIWVAGGTGTNSLAWSNDGINWTGLGTTAFPGGVWDICWNGTRFIATGTTYMGYSTDGKTWYSVNNSLFSPNGLGVSSNPGIGAFVAPSAMVLNNTGPNGNAVVNSQTLEIVSSDPYFQQGFQNVSVNLTSSIFY